jgi:hypothetical protein
VSPPDSQWPVPDAIGGNWFTLFRQKDDLLSSNPSGNAVQSALDIPIEGHRVFPILPSKALSVHGNARLPLNLSMEGLEGRVSGDLNIHLSEKTRRDSLPLIHYGRGLHALELFCCYLGLSSPLVPA